MKKTMSLSTMEQAFHRVGIKRVVKRVSWPRCKGPRALRVDVKTGHLVGCHR